MKEHSRLSYVSIFIIDFKYHYLELSQITNSARKTSHNLWLNTVSNRETFSHKQTHDLRKGLQRNVF